MTGDIPHKYTTAEIDRFNELNPQFSPRYGIPWQIIQLGDKQLLIFVEQQGSRNHAYNFLLIKNGKVRPFDPDETEEHNEKEETREKAEERGEIFGKVI